MEYQYINYLDRAKKRIEKHPEEITYTKQGLAQLKKYYEQEQEKQPSMCYWTTQEKEAEVYEKLKEYLKHYLVQESTDILRKKIKVNQSLQPVTFSYLWKKIKQEHISKLNPVASMYHYYGKIEDYRVQYLLESYYYAKLFQKNKFNQAFLNLYHEIEQGNQKIIDQIKKQPEEEKRKILRDFQLYEKMQQMNEEEQVYYYIKEIDGPHLEQTRRNIIINNLQNAIQFLDEFGRIEFYLKLDQKNRKAFGLPNEQIHDKKDLLEQFKTENLESYETPKLLLLNSFWQNRVEKEIDSISRNLFVEHHLEQEENQNKDQKTNQEKHEEEGKNQEGNQEKYEEEQEETIEYLLYRYWITQQIDHNMRKEIELSTTQKTNRLTQKKKVMLQNIHYDQVGKDFMERYHLNFGLRGENNEPNCFIKDALENCMVFGLQDLTYELKTEAAVELIDFYRNSSQLYNWGYLPEDETSEKQEPSSVLLLAFDYPGMDGILRLHFQRDKLLEIWEAEGEDTYIPVYQGKEDQKIGNRILKNYLYMPMTKEQESAYIEQYKKGNGQKVATNYVQHIVANCLGKIKYKKIKPILPNKWYDIKTREYGSKRMGKFEPDAQFGDGVI